MGEDAGADGGAELHIPQASQEGDEDASDPDDPEPGELFGDDPYKDEDEETYASKEWEPGERFGTAADDAREATWAPLLRLEREARAAADAARAASGGGVDMGHGEESEESEEEYDAWHTYYEIFDNNFDYDL